MSVYVCNSNTCYGVFVLENVRTCLKVKVGVLVNNITIRKLSYFKAMLVMFNQEAKRIWKLGHLNYGYWIKTCLIFQMCVCRFLASVNGRYQYWIVSIEVTSTDIWSFEYTYLYYCYPILRLTLFVKKKVYKLRWPLWWRHIQRRVTS